MKRIYLFVVCALLLAAAAWTFTSCHKSNAESTATGSGDPIKDNALRMLDEGRQTFRYDTFGSEAFWGDTLKLHSAISGTANGGVGAGVSPATALSVGLKVDLDALPADLVTQLKNGTVNLNDPATTLALLKLNAVVGITGIFDAAGKLTSLGIQCAFCHSTVDDALVPGIGHRLDGWNNQDLNVGAIVNLSPDLTPVVTLLSPALPGITQDIVRTVLQSWGPGKFDAELFMDGKAFNPTQIVNSVGFSLINNQVGLGNPREFRTLFWWNLTLTAMLAILGTAGVFLFSDRILSFFGASFSDASLTLVILSVSAVAEAVAIGAYQVVQSRAEMWRSLFMVALPRDLTILTLSYFLVQPLGAAGLALAGLCGWGVAVVTVVAIVRRLGIRPAICFAQGV